MLRYDVLKYGVTQSQLMNYLGCRRYAELSHEGWRQKRPASYFRYGEIAHAILEEVYKTYKVPPNELQIRKLVELASVAYQNKNKLFQSPEDEQVAEIQGAMLETTLYEYFQYWGKEDFSKVKWLEQEKEFGFNVLLNSGTKIRVKGKRDATYKVGSDICLFETKTKSQIDENSLYELLAMDFQVDLYSLSLRYEYGRYPIKCRYNIIRRPGNKLGKGETLQSFANRLREAVKNDPEHYFKRYSIDISKNHMTEFENELKHILTEYWQWATGSIPTYKNTRSCVTKYGTCQYLPICSYGNYGSFHRIKEAHPELQKQEA